MNLTLTARTPMPDRPEVSVVIPTRSRWHLLSTAALPSALEQEDVEVEVIVVDDGSSDETPERLAAHDDPRLLVIRHDESQGRRGRSQRRHRGRPRPLGELPRRRRPLGSAQASRAGRQREGGGRGLRVLGGRRARRRARVPVRRASSRPGHDHAGAPALERDLVRLLERPRPRRRRLGARRLRRAARAARGLGSVDPPGARRRRRRRPQRCSSATSCTTRACS